MNINIKYGLALAFFNVGLVMLCMADMYFHFSGSGESNLGAWLLIYSTAPIMALTEYRLQEIGFIWPVIVNSTIFFIAGFLIGYLHKPLHKEE